MEPIEATRIKSPSHTDDGVEKSKQSRQGEVGLGRYCRCSKEKTEVKEQTVRNDDKTTKKALKDELEGKRSRGRQQRRWIDNFK